MDPPSPHRMRIHPLIRPPPPPPPPSSTDTNFPILAISILGILTTAILLLSYYIFVIKCCLNWRSSNALRRLSRSRHISSAATAAPSYSAAASESRGLEESAIQAIPAFRYKGGADHRRKMASFHECAVCLNEFQEEESIRLLPTCLHVFHIDCIDTWLQSNANCPLCRSGITPGSSVEAEKLMLVSSSPRSGDIVMEVREQEEAQGTEEQERRRRRRRRHHVGSMGDECINVRGGKDGELCVQPIRRSFSMDSSSNQQLYQAVQEILQRNPHFKGVAGGEGSAAAAAGGGDGGRARRNFFSFGNHRSSRRSVLPIQGSVAAF